MKKGDVGMAKVRKEGMSFNYLQSATSLHHCQEQTAKTIMVSEVRIQVFSIIIIIVEKCMANTCIRLTMTP